MDLFKTKQSQDIKKKTKNTKTEIIKSFENIFVTFDFLKISNQPNTLLSISQGRGRAGGLVCLLWGQGARHLWPLCLVFKASIFLGIKPHSLLTLLDVMRPP